MKTWTATFKHDVLTDLVDDSDNHITSLCGGDVSLDDHLTNMQARHWEKVSDSVNRQGVRTIIHRQLL